MEEDVNPEPLPWEVEEIKCSACGGQAEIKGGWCEACKDKFAPVHQGRTIKDLQFKLKLIANECRKDRKKEWYD
jgi:hypothetical protein